MGHDYFSEQIAKGQPIVPPTAAQAPSVEPKQPATPEEFKGLPVRESGDNIYLLKDGQKRWITTAEVYASLGFKFGDEQKIDKETLDLIPEGEPIR